MNQLIRLIIGRLMDFKGGNQSVGDYKYWPFTNDKLESLSLSQKANLVQDILQNRTEYAGPGGVWEKLAQTFIRLAGTDTRNLDALIMV